MIHEAVTVLLGHSNVKDQVQAQKFAPPEAYEDMEDKLAQCRLDPTVYGFKEVSSLKKFQPDGFSKYQVSKSIKPDGNCQFSAFSMLVNGKQDNHHILRKEAVEYIRKHPQEFQDFLHDGNTIEKYCKRMSVPGTFGDNLTIVSLASFYQRNVVLIKDTYQHLLKEEISKAHPESTFLGLYLHGDHYELLLDAPEAPQD